MSTTEEQIAQLRAAVTALEGQRPILGDAVVEVALDSLRERLAALEVEVRVEQQRKQVTVLFADVFGFTALSETTDAEEVAEVMNTLWAQVDRAIVDGGGRIDKHIGDAVMALWGVDAAREDDPERAVRAALAMQAAAGAFRDSQRVPLAMRIGVNTGPVLLGQVGTTAEFTAIGDTVNLASRLEHAAAVGSVLISHDTYRHVRGIFDILPREPLTVKGKAEPVQTYVVLRARPRAFRSSTRGVEGIETRMIGRERELGRLQNAYVEATTMSQTRLALVVGEAGVGKSRLLYEFETWLELWPETIQTFQGRATPNLQNVPYSLFRDLFAERFDILDSDSAAVALEKFRAGMAGVLSPEQADIVGYWLGFDFSASPAVGGLVGSTGFGTVARAHLTRAFRALAAGAPVIILLEDIHWADDPSLDLAIHLATAIPEAPLLVLALARPRLFERRPNWGQELAGHTRVTLTPLTTHLSRTLVDEILRLVNNVPDTLRDLIVNAAEGNPFYVEELVKMLIDQGVIERGEEGARGQVPGAKEEHSSLEPGPWLLASVWRVRTDKLAALKVPPTLTALLQARLDGLPPAERRALQRAAVVGRLFWDDPVADLLRERRDEVAVTLQSARSRELILRQERSSFAGAGEYLFKHALLRDVAYETVLLKYRAEFHGRVARWLEDHAGERVGEYLGLIAEHYVQAGEYDRAADYYQRSGEQAIRTNVFRAARVAFERALSLRELSNAPPEASLPHYLMLGNACHRLGEFAVAEPALTRALALARAGDRSEYQPMALASLAMVVYALGRTAEAGALLEEALPLARQAGGLALGQVLRSLSSYEWQTGALDAAEAHAEEGRHLAIVLGDITLEISAYSSLGIIEGLRGNFDGSRRYIETSLALARQIGDRYQESVSESNLGATIQYAGDYAGAIVHYRAGLQVYEELGMIDNMATNAHNIADAYTSLGLLDESRRYAVECIRLARQVGAVPLQLAALVPLADVLAKQGQPDRALALLGLARHHPGTPTQKEVGIREVLADMQLEPEQIEAGLAAGAALALEAVMEEILAGQW